MYEEIMRLKAYAATCRASIINEDAMTALELAGCTAKKVNEVISLVNEMLTMIEQLHEAYYDPDAETLAI